MDQNKIWANYQHRAQYYGDEDVKKALTRVKRVSTEVNGFCKDWNLDVALSASDADKLRAAAEVLRKLARVMEPLPARARKEKVDYEKRSTVEEAARLDKLAEGQDWAKDETSIRREAELLGELLDGRNHVVEWVQHHLKRPEIKYVSWSGSGCACDQLNVLRDPSADLTKKRRAVAFVKDSFKVDRHDAGPDFYYLTPADYVAWREWKDSINQSSSAGLARETA